MCTSARSPAVPLIVAWFATIFIWFLLLVHAAEVHGVRIPDVRGRDFEAFPKGGFDVAHDNLTDGLVVALQLRMLCVDVLL